MFGGNVGLHKIGCSEAVWVWPVESVLELAIADLLSTPDPRPQEKLPEESRPTARDRDE